MTTSTEYQFSRRKFDHADAFTRYNNGERVRDLASEYGVTETSIYYALQVEKSTARKRKHITKICPDCGVGISRNSKRCKDCAHKAMVITVRDTQLRCTCCKKWKQDDDFHQNKNTPLRRFRTWTCKDCSSLLHKNHREKTRIPCEGKCGRTINLRERRNEEKPWLCVSCAPGRTTLTRTSERENFLPLLGKV